MFDFVQQTMCKGFFMQLSECDCMLQLFKDPAPMGAKKVEWEEVIGAANGIAKHATTSK